MARRNAKIVCVLRDPSMLRQSWYNHVERLFRAFLPLETFDYELDDFVQVPLGPPEASNIVTTVGGSLDYEDYVSEVVRAHQAHPGRVHIVFFEDMLAHPAAVIRELAEFTGWGLGNEELIEELAEATIVPLRRPPRYGHAARMIIEDRWDTKVRRNHPSMVDYKTLYKELTLRPWPISKELVKKVSLKRMASRKKVTVAETSSQSGEGGGFLARLFRRLFGGGGSSGSKRASRDIKELKKDRERLGARRKSRHVSARDVNYSNAELSKQVRAYVKDELEDDEGVDEAQY